MINKVMLILTGILFCMPVLAKDQVSIGKEKSLMCVSCHGVKGKASASGYPNLAGQNEQYLVNALQAYKQGERRGGQAEIMRAYVTDFSDEDIRHLAAYFSALKP